MKRPWRITGATGGIGISIAVAIYASGGLRPAPVATQTEPPECTSCDARKKDLSRLRNALGAAKQVD